jgi:tripartite-type tricarboxylate transporter receptor subunit TctC
MYLTKAKRVLGLAILAAALPLAVLAQGYPLRPITVIVVFAAGGPSDTIARLLSDHVGRQFGQQLVIENVAGAGGTDRAANATPDGYTILTHHSGLTAAPALYSNLKFDSRTAFEPMGLINTGPMVVLSRKTLETKTLAELVAWLKEKGDKATIAFAGVGSNSYVCATVLQQQIGVKLAMVPYRGTGPAMNDLVGGQIDVLCDQATTAVPQIQGGTVKAYAVTSAQRLASLQDVPSNKEAGLPGLEVTIWNGAYAPKGTPKEVIDRWNAAIGKFVADPAIIERFAATGTVPFPPEMRSPAAHAKFLTEQFEFYAKMFAAANVKKEEAK